VTASIGVVLIATRSLDQRTAGIFFTVTTLFLIADVVARLGTDTGLVYAISRARTFGFTSRVSAYLRVALVPVVGLSLVLAVAMFVGAPVLSEVLTDDRGDDTVEALRALAILLPLTAVSNTLVSATRGYSTMLPTVIVDRVGRPGLQLVAVALVATAGSAAALSVAWAAPWALAAMFGGWWLVHLQRTRLPDATSDDGPHRVWHEFWSFTGFRAATSIVQLLLQRLDVVLLSLLAGPVHAATYMVATRFIVIGQFVNQALSNVVEPRLSRLLALGDAKAVRAVYRVATGWLIILCWPFYLLIAVYAADVLSVFGEGYDDGVPVVLVLVATMLAATSVGMVDVVLLMSGRAGWSLLNAGLALTVNVSADVLLIPHLGILGAAVGWAAAILTRNLLSLVQVWRSSRVHPFGAGPLTAAALATCCFGLLPLTVRLLYGDVSTAAAAATALGIVLYVSACWRWRGPLGLSAWTVAPRR
jgi:O-antigen/teichoic acid export membrane protein